jgi:putative inorganic carbon (hco3(-)) transporter
MTASQPSEGVLRSWLPRRLDKRWILFAVPAVVVGAIAGASPHPFLIVAAVGAAAFFVAALEYPVAVLAFFVLLTFVSQLAGVGASVSVAKGAGGVLVVSWLYRRLAHRGAALDSASGVAPFVVGSAALCTWMVLSATWSSDTHAAIAAAFRLLQGPLIAIVIVATVTSVAAFRIIAVSYVAGATLSAVVGMTGVTKSDNAYLVASGRLSGGISDPNFLAAVLVPALLIALFAFQTTRSRSSRLVIAFAGCACLAGIFLTESRGGIIGLAVATTAAVAYAGPVRRQILVSLAVTAAFALIYFSFAPPQSLQRLTSFSTDGGTGRSDLWTVAAKAFTVHPVGGVGAGNYTLVEPQYLLGVNKNLPRADLVLHNEVVHNTYLQTAAELGVVGIALLLFTIFVPLFYARRAVAAFPRNSVAFEAVIGRGIVPGVLGMLASFTFLTAQYEKQLWITLGIVLAYNRVAALAASSQAHALSPSEHSF